MTFILRILIADLISNVGQQIRFINSACLTLYNQKSNIIYMCVCVIMFSLTPQFLTLNA